MIYSLFDDKTKVKYFSSNSSIASLKKKNDSLFIERMSKLKKMMLALREEMDELKSRVDDLEDEDYEPSSQNDEEESDSESD